MSTRPMLTQREAAAACGVSRTTIRRRREAGDLPNSVQDEVRGWLIPVDDLLAAGLRLHAPSDPDKAAPSSPAGQDADVDVDQEHDAIALRAELENLRHKHALAVAAAEHGRQLAEAEATHLRAQLAARADHIADLQRTLKALMPGPERPVLQPSVPGQAQNNEPHVPAASPDPDAGPAAGERRRWWRRS
ncbi:helix-turn-helix transcriptional regulator [Streptomyces sp. NPDC058595]|uniref:helix-turn-helix transcriptional regulator n=1 Tax=Streptomyces sp. NPDC058595 TaxID=3346550 RepID=UPI00365E869E